MSEFKTPHGEAGKEFLRTFIITLIPVLVLALESGSNWKITAVAVAIAALRALEKFAHQWNKLPEEAGRLPELPF